VRDTFLYSIALYFYYLLCYQFTGEIKLCVCIRTSTLASVAVPQHKAHTNSAECSQLRMTSDPFVGPMWPANHRCNRSCESVTAVAMSRSMTSDVRPRRQASPSLPLSKVICDVNQSGEFTNWSSHHFHSDDIFTAVAQPNQLYNGTSTTNSLASTSSFIFSS